ncbi:tyrosine-type recombinase/integrase [Ruminococcus albus]|uniref:tyrosine-type recombinase/integrase n=1 Tax=Ruminococcus albus TaxID=1264 RepID=UPI000465359B|nr:tyrosine-type recombinase/integrase [Ruminococcus albus]
MNDTVLDISFRKYSLYAIRRTAASNIYNTGAGIKLTADILGHDSIDSSTHYVKVDFESLRSLCCEWPEKEAAE